MSPRIVATLAAVTAALHVVPTLTSLQPVRRVLFPSLCGLGTTDRVALTYDDGPDPRSTPEFLELLQSFGVAATFFLLGEHVGPNEGLVKEMSARGHELAVHGWNHRCVLTKSPGLLTAELARTKALVEDLTGEPVRWYRPPYGVLTGAALLAARRCGLRPVLWSSWGRDWSRRATPASIVIESNRRLRPGGNLLLHDSDRTAAPGSWRKSLAATSILLQQWADHAVAVGSIGSGLEPVRAST